MHTDTYHCRPWAHPLGIYVTALTREHAESAQDDSCDDNVSSVYIERPRAKKSHFKPRQTTRSRVFAPQTTPERKTFKIVISIHRWQVGRAQVNSSSSKKHPCCVTSLQNVGTFPPFWHWKYTALFCRLKKAQQEDSCIRRCLSLLT